MRNKMKNWWQKIAANRAFAAVGSVFGRVWALISNNLGLKVLSLLMAVLLWHFVITTDTTITRTKSVTDLSGYISGQSTLNTYGLALLENPTEELKDISVLLEVSQSEYSYASENNVQVTLDLSSVRTAGTQQVPLKASTSYGRVVRIMPESLTLTFEPLDSRIIPVNVQITGDDGKGMWYNVNRSNPANLTISGAASVVQSIASAYVYVDAAGTTSSFTVAEEYSLLDGAGRLIPQTMLNRSSSSISVNVGVYPMKEIPIADDVADVITGQPADGYVIESVSIQPQTLTVAAEAELLENLEELLINPVSVQGRSQSFSARASISSLSAFKNLSAEQVYVNVNIVEETAGAWVEDVKVSFTGKGEKLGLESESTIRVYVTGPRSAIEMLRESGFVATVDLTGLAAGSYDLPLDFPTETYPNVTFTPEVSELEVVLTELGETAN